MKISFDRIIEGALSTFFGALIVSAGIIVWTQAMSVNDKVNAAKEELSILVNNLSDQLVKYELSLNSLSNQISILNIKRIESPILGSSPLASSSSKTNNTSELDNLRKKDMRYNIQQSLIKK